MKNLKSSALFQNASILLFLQLFSYVVPFLLLPYLSRTLGVDGFGSLATLWVLGAYIQILIDFGFYLWATKECAMLKNDSAALSKLWIVVFTIKGAIGFASLFIMVGFSFVFSAPFWLYAFMWLSILSQALMPTWLFQGVQRVLPLLVFSLSAQIFGAILTIYFVKSADDIVFVSFASALSWTFFSLIANYYVYKKFSLSLNTPRIDELRQAINGAWHLFTANIAVAFYNNLPAFMLTILATKSEIAVFIGAQKIVLALSGLFAPISSAIFPKIAELTKNSVKYADIFIKRAVIITLLVMGSLALSVFVFADTIVSLALGSGFEESAALLRIMAAGPVFVAINTLMYSGYIVIRDLASKMKMFFLTISVGSLFVSVFAVFFAKSHGAAFLYVLIEVAVFSGLLWKIKKFKGTDGAK